LEKRHGEGGGGDKKLGFEGAVGANEVRLEGWRVLTAQDCAVDKILAKRRGRRVRIHPRQAS
jgi:hypothetical protein